MLPDCDVYVDVHSVTMVEPLLEVAATLLEILNGQEVDNKIIDVKLIKRQSTSIKH